MERLSVTNAEFEVYDFWNNFHNYLKNVTCLTHKRQDTESLDFFYYYSQIRDQELNRYNARFFYLELCVEFDSQQDLTLFLLEWS